MIKHVISISGGKDSQAVALIALARVPREFLIFIFCDTGNEDQSVYDHLDYLEVTLSITIIRLKAEFSEQIAAKRIFISRDQRNKRVYKTEAVFEADGKTPVWKRNGFGKIVTKLVKKAGKPFFTEFVQKAIKIGGGSRERWTNKAKRRALSVLYPSGNPYLDLCMWKGRFPSRKAQFCTTELKTSVAVEFQMSLMDQGYGVVSWQGVRRDESDNRKDAKLFERVGKRLWIFRPIVNNTAQEVVDFSLSKGIKVCQLYSEGSDRVGCMPCVNCGKDEVKQTSIRRIHHIHRISDWEKVVAQASKRGLATFFPAPGLENHVAAKQDIWTVVEWSKTTRGGRQFDLLADLEQPTGCSSSYGLCDQPSRMAA